VSVAVDTKDHMAQHFGIGKKRNASKAHRKALTDLATQPRIDKPKPEEPPPEEEVDLKSRRAAFETELASVCAKSGIAATQLEEFFPLFQRYTKEDLAGGLPKKGSTLLAKRLHGAALVVQDDMRKEREGYQQHIAQACTPVSCSAEEEED
jgi:hypothetical protein